MELFYRICLLLQESIRQDMDEMEHVKDRAMDLNSRLGMDDDDSDAGSDASDAPTSENFTKYVSSMLYIYIYFFLFLFV